MFVRHRTTLVIVLPLLVGSLLACPSKKPATVGSSSTSNPSVATTRLPACIRGFVLEGAPGAPRPSPPIPTPSVSPQSGTKGARVTISGSGMAPNVSVDIVAFYGGDNCLIKGPGDEFLGVTRSNGTGAYAFSTRWPTNFRPYAGRGQQPGRRSRRRDRCWNHDLPGLRRSPGNVQQQQRTNGTDIPVDNRRTVGQGRA